MKHLPMLTIMMLAMSGAGATEIFQWIDDEGVVHFSDTRPESDVAVKALHVNKSTPADYDPQDDPYSILNQAARMNRSWAELEKIRDERAEKRREEAERNRRYVELYEPDFYYQRPGRYFWNSGRYPPTIRPPQNRVTRQQAYALQQTGLDGRRPNSINSGTHHARVQRSQALPLVGPPPRPAPRPMSRPVSRP